MIASSIVRHSRRASQHGNFMLEALIAILIVALGILGTVGLYARSVQTVEDSKYRSEAALLASTLVGEMWVSDTHPASLTAKFDSAGAGAGITEFKALVAKRLPSSTAPTPTVTVTPGATAGSSNVEITIQWVHPGDAARSRVAAISHIRDERDHRGERTMNPMSRLLSSAGRQRGVGLVETMVGILIGTIVIVVVYNILWVAESYKRTTVGSSDAQITGLLSQFVASRDASNGGAGLTMSNGDMVNCTRIATAAAPARFHVRRYLAGGRHPSHSRPDHRRWRRRPFRHLHFLHHRGVARVVAGRLHVERRAGRTDDRRTEPERIQRSVAHCRRAVLGGRDGQ